MSGSKQKQKLKILVTSISISYVRHSTITHVGTVQQTLGRYLVGTVQKSGTVHDFSLYRTARLSAGCACGALQCRMYLNVYFAAHPYIKDVDHTRPILKSILSNIIFHYL